MPIIEEQHLKLINRCPGISNSSDKLERYQTKIKKLAQSLEKDILQGPAQELFNTDDINSIQHIMSTLTKFNKTITKVKELKILEERHRAEAIKIVLEKAKILVREKYPWDKSSYLIKLRFCLAINCVNGRELKSMMLDTIATRINYTSAEWVNDFQDWINSTYLNCIRDCIYMIVNHSIGEFDQSRTTVIFKKIDDELLQIDMKAKKVLENAAQYLSKNTLAVATKY